VSGIDIIIAIPLVWGAFKGFRKGIISEIAQIIAVILGFMLASKYSHYLYNTILKVTSLSEQTVSIIAFIISFLTVVTVIILLAHFTTFIVKAIALGWLNRITGMLLGIVKYALIIGVLLFAIIRIDSKEQFIKPKTKESSILLQPVCLLAAYTIPYLKKMIAEKND
jgi:membrane protein required for colicin V production